MHKETITRVLHPKHSQFMNESLLLHQRVMVWESVFCNSSCWLKWEDLRTLILRREEEVGLGWQIDYVEKGKALSVLQGTTRTEPGVIGMQQKNEQYHWNTKNAKK